MAFANFSVFAIGGLLAGIPIVLHLMMKRKPRHQVFPAMRFLQQKKVANQRQMRLRHWLLLALRIAAIVFLASLFARPSVDSAASGYWLKTLLLAVLCPFAVVAAVYCWIESKTAGLTATFATIGALIFAGLLYFGFLALTANQKQNLGDEKAPVAAALVFDTSPRMGLIFQNKTRLEEAQFVASSLLQQLPADSEVAIVDASAPGIFSMDIGNSVNMVDSLQVLGEERPLSDLINQAMELVAKRDDKRQEVYVLTDLSKAAWETREYEALRSRLQQTPSISLFILDVGARLPRNLQLDELRLSSDSLATGQLLRIETNLRALNIADREVTVDVAIERADSTRPVIVDNEVLLPEAVTRDRVQQSLAGQTELPIALKVRGLTPGIHHGTVRTVSQDGLSIDNQRYFTVEVRPPLPVLIVAGDDSEPMYAVQAISPTELQQRGENAFDCEVVAPHEILSRTLDDYVAIAILDPPPLATAHWQRLEAFVNRGGGIALFLGRNAAQNGVSTFNQVAGNTLPGPLGTQWRAPRGSVLQLAIDDTSHPALSLFRGRESTVSWNDSPIFRHWSITELQAGANVIARFSNNQPALVETVLGNGRILTMLTPISDRKQRTLSWNQLPTSSFPLPFYMLMNGMFPYLANHTGATWNHRVGAVVDLPTPDSGYDATWQLFTPQLDWQNVRSDDGKLLVTSTNAPGHYRLKRDQETSTGFSANLPSSATRLERLETNQLDEILGKNRYTLSRGTEELSREIGRARVGRELFPFLMLCVVGIVFMEYVVSNRFYSVQTV